MIIFYTNNIDNQTAYLEDAEHKHCTRVLRKKVGDEISFIDGMGSFYNGNIKSISKKQTELEITKTIKSESQKPYIHIAIAPTKNMSRYEWFLEKATEIGISEITPIIGYHSERKVLKMERCEMILVSAMKQSLKTHLPKLNDTIPLSELLEKEFSQKKLIASFKDGNPDLIDFKNEDCVILIGPEGDFSEKEISLAEECGWLNVNLAKYRLRTETAGIVACTLLNS